MRSLYVDELFVGAWVRTSLGAGRICSVSAGDEIPICIGGGVSEPVMFGYGEIAPLHIDDRILEGFGFFRTKGDNVWKTRVGDFSLTVGLRPRHGVMECRRCAFTGRTSNWNEDIRYVHELQRWWTDKVLIPFGVCLSLEWRGKEVMGHGG